MTRKQTARLSGALYVAMAVPGGLALTYFPSAFVVPGDATATASRIAAAPALYRLGVFSDLICAVFAIWLGMVLYDLFKDVDRSQARLLVGFVFGMVAAGLVNTVLMAAPLVFTSGASYLSVFDKHQLDALTLGVVGLRSQGIHVATMYWGLWLLPLGVLVYRSGFMPRLLGVLVIIAGCAYVVDCVAYYFFPHYAGTIALVSTLPQAAGEGGFAFYALIKGVRSERPADGPLDPGYRGVAAG
jgi:hypothetical protein